MKLKAIDVDMYIVLVLTALGIVLALTVPTSWLPLRILTVPLVFILPGYAFISALFPTQRLGTAERLILSLGVSLAVVILGGLLLNLTPFGLRTDSWALFLGGFTLGACVVTIARRRGQHASLSARAWNPFTGTRPRLRYGIIAGLALVVVGGAVALSLIGAQQQLGKGFTQLWMLPAGGTSQAKNAVSLGISNMESQDMTYRLAVSMDGAAIKEWPSIEVSAGQQWKATLTLPPSGHPGAARIEAVLYRVDSHKTIYRDVVLWFSTT